MKIVVFSVGDKEYGADIIQVREVIRMRPVISIPDVADFVEGVVSLRGKIITLINLRVKLGLAKQKLQKTNRIIITQFNEHMAGVIVDNVSGVLNITQEAITMPDDMLKGADYLLGVARREKRLILIVDILKLLSHDAAKSIQKVQESIEVRKKSSK
ncbi:MAG: chemotaxis protein CheW [Candidatus Omnitrophota bacterium]